MAKKTNTTAGVVCSNLMRVVSVFLILNLSVIFPKLFYVIYSAGFPASKSIPPRDGGILKLHSDNKARI